MATIRETVTACLPDWIGVGLPAATVAMLCDLKTASVSTVLRKMVADGTAVREKPTEEWPFVYALQSQAHPSPALEASVSVASKGE